MQALSGFWWRLRSSMWFLPGLMALAAIVLAFGLLALDQAYAAWLRDQLPHLFTGSADGARAILSTTAGSTITVAGVVFSITIVVFSLAASQYTSRVLGNFMSDRLNQMVFGAFVGIFIYCLIVMRSVAAGADGFIPALSLLVAMVLALGGVACLIFFIHHIVESVQASHVIESVACSALDTIDRYYPEPETDGDQARLPENRALENLQWRSVFSGRPGYVQRVDHVKLCKLACECDGVVEVVSAPGEFVFGNRPLARVSGPQASDKSLHNTVASCFVVSHDRSVEQDVAYGIRRLVDVALKALSPAVNVTTNAIMCVDYITVILCRLAPRPLEPPHQYQEGRIRVIAQGPDFERLVTLAFTQVRENANNNFAVLSRQLSSLDSVLEATRDPRRVKVLHTQFESTIERVKQTIEDSNSRARLQATINALKDRFEQVQSAA